MAMTRHSLQPLCGDKGRTMCICPPVSSEMDDWVIEQRNNPGPARGSARSGLGLLGARPAQAEGGLDCFGRCRPVASHSSHDQRAGGARGKWPGAKGARGEGLGVKRKG